MGEETQACEEDYVRRFGRETERRKRNPRNPFSNVKRPVNGRRSPTHSTSVRRGSPRRNGRIHPRGTDCNNKREAQHNNKREAQHMGDEDRGDSGSEPAGWSWPLPAFLKQFI